MGSLRERGRVVKRGAEIRKQLAAWGLGVYESESREMSQRRLAKDLGRRTRWLELKAIAGQVSMSSSSGLSKKLRVEEVGGSTGRGMTEFRDGERDGEHTVSGELQGGGPSQLHQIGARRGLMER
jgi:hypothetical protein